MAQMSWSKRWMKPEIYPLFLSLGAAVGLTGFAVARNLAINPDVRINKDDRAAGVLENHKEGDSYGDNGLRKFVRGYPPQGLPKEAGMEFQRRSIPKDGVSRSTRPTKHCG